MADTLRRGGACGKPTPCDVTVTWRTGAYHRDTIDGDLVQGHTASAGEPGAGRSAPVG